MKSVKEIKEMQLEWGHGRKDDSSVIGEICDALIAITERLEAQEEPYPCDTCEMVINPNQREDIRRVARRDGMIDALRWVNDRMPTGRSTITFALDRLENGGDL